MSSKKPTGAALGRLYNELVAGGVPDETASDIVREVAIREINDFGYVLAEEVAA
jgi:hypothetical protein